MSDLLIKGMEMPKPGAYTCELGVLDDNTAVLTIYTPINEPQKSYTLIPVQTHGRLIDADAVFDNLERTGWYDNADRDIAEDLVLDAPTFIPASGEET